MQKDNEPAANIRYSGSEEQWVLASEQHDGETFLQFIQRTNSKPTIGGYLSLCPLTKNLWWVGAVIFTSNHEILILYKKVQALFVDAIWCVYLKHLSDKKNCTAPFPRVEIQKCAECLNALDNLLENDTQHKYFRGDILFRCHSEILRKQVLKIISSYL